MKEHQQAVKNKLTCLQGQPVEVCCINQNWK